MKTSGEMYLPLNPNGSHVFPQQDRGMRVHGFVSRFRANPNPTASESFERPEDGFARNKDTRANYAEVPLGGSQMKRLERMVNRYLHNDAGRADTAKDTATLLKDSGHEPMVTLERLTNLVRRGILAERLGFGSGVRQGEPSNPAGASNAETTEPEEIPINIEVLEEPRSRAGVPLAVPPPSRTTTVVITVDEPGEANAGPSRVEVDVPNPPQRAGSASGSRPEIIEISSGDEQEAGVAQPIGRRARQPYAAAPSAGSRTNVRGRSPDDDEKESRRIKRRRVA